MMAHTLVDFRRRGIKRTPGISIKNDENDENDEKDENDENDENDGHARCRVNRVHPLSCKQGTPAVM